MLLSSVRLDPKVLKHHVSLYNEPVSSMYWFIWLAVAGPITVTMCCSDKETVKLWHTSLSSDTTSFPHYFPITGHVCEWQIL